MFTVFQLITIIAIVIAVVFLVMFIQLNAFTNSQRKILFLLAVLGIFLFVIELLISYRIYDIVVYLFPFYYIIVFVIYPLFYLYFRKYVFGEMHIAFSNSYRHLILTGLAAIFLLLYYLPLDYDNKIDLILSEFVIRSVTDVKYQYFRCLIYIPYYLQFLVYLILFIRLDKKLQIYDHQEKMNIDIPVRTWIRLFIAGSIFIEVSILVVDFCLSPAINQAIEQVFSLAYISYIGFLGINQSKLLIHVRLYQATGRTVKKDRNIQSASITNEDERRELRRLIELVIKEKKLHLNPDLKLEHLARQIHVPNKKLSHAIHAIYDKNFSNFINDYRIMEAIMLLKTGNRIRSEELCRRVGFNSRSTFNRAFKIVTGMTPRDYMIQHKIAGNL